MPDLYIGLGMVATGAIIDHHGVASLALAAYTHDGDCVGTFLRHLVLPETVAYDHHWLGDHIEGPKIAPQQALLDAQHWLKILGYHTRQNTGVLVSPSMTDLAWMQLLMARHLKTSLFSRHLHLHSYVLGSQGYAYFTEGYANYWKPEWSHPLDPSDPDLIHALPRARLSAVVAANIIKETTADRGVSS